MSKKCEDIKETKCVLHQIFPTNCESSPHGVIVFVNVQLYSCKIYILTLFSTNIYKAAIMCHGIDNKLQNQTPFFPS